MEILPYLTTAKRGYACKSDLCEVIQSILYKLKTGCQWHLIPTAAIFTEVVLSYKTIFGKFRQWCNDGSWQKSWESLLSCNHDKLEFFTMLEFLTRGATSPMTYALFVLSYF